MNTIAIRHAAVSLLVLCSVAATTVVGKTTASHGLGSRVDNGHPNASTSDSPRYVDISHKSASIDDRRVLFGPYKYVTSDSEEVHSFAAAPTRFRSFRLDVRQVDGAIGRIAIVLNGAQVVSLSDLTGATHSISLAIALYESNDIRIEASSDGGLGLLVTLSGEPIPVTDVVLSPTSLYVGEFASVSVTAAVAPDGQPIEPTVVLEERTQQGSFVDVGAMSDAGNQVGDGYAGDGIYRLSRSVFSATPVEVVMRIRVTNSDYVRYSDEFILHIFHPTTPADTASIEPTVFAARELYRAQEPLLGHATAVAAAVASLQASPAVSSISLDAAQQSVAIEFVNGLHGTLFFDVSPDFQAKSKSSHRDLNPQKSVRTGDKVTNGEPISAVGNRRALIVSSHPDHIEPFTANAIVSLLEGSACPTFEVNDVRGGGLAEPIAELRRMSQYGIIAIEAHADANVILTGQDNSDLDLDDRQLQEDFNVVPRRVTLGWYTWSQAIPVDIGQLGITPEFVRHYARGRLPNSAVFLAGCNTLRNDGAPMAEAFRDSGANTVFGYNDYSLASFHSQTIVPVLQRWLEVSGTTLRQAFVPGLVETFPYKGRIVVDEFVSMNGTRAGATPPPGELVNGDFETGTTEGWYATTSFRGSPSQVVPAYAGVLPSEGRFMAMTKLDAETLHFSGALGQRVSCIEGKRLTYVVVDINFVAPNLGGTLPTSVCWSNNFRMPFLDVLLFGSETAFGGYSEPRVFVNELCGTQSLVPSVLPCADFVDPDGLPGPCNGVWQTGWRRFILPISSTPATADDEWTHISLSVDGDAGNPNYFYGVVALIDNVELIYEDRTAAANRDGVRKVDLGASGALGHQRSFQSEGGIEIPDEGSALPYASEILVDGFGGGGGDRGDGVAIESVRVTLNGLSHTFPDDLDVMLESPTGVLISLMSDAGGGRNLERTTITFDDDALVGLPDDAEITTGSYRPTNHPQLFHDEFPIPAPNGPISVALSELAGSNPIGAWRLWVVDNAIGDRGLIDVGWELDIRVVNRIPIALCGDVTVTANDECVAWADINTDSYDPDGDVLEFVQSPAGPYSLGQTTVTLTVADAFGGVSSCAATVSVVDGMAPTVVCPSPATQNVGSGCTAVIPDFVSGSTAADSCSSSGSLTWSQAPAAGTVVAPGIHAVTISVADGSNNTGTCATTFTVVDAQPPTITGPIPALLPRTSSSADGTTVTFPTPSASDNCGNVIVTATPASGTTFPNGKTLVTSTAVDSAGLSASAQFTVKVVRFGESIGIYIPSTAGWFLKNTNTNGAADLTFSFGPGGDGWVPISGDWNRSGTDTPGLFYNPTAGVFLSDTNGPGGADYVFTYGPSGLNWIPLAGDWNGEGVDSIGLYDPTTGNFFLKNINAAGNADVILQLGPGNAGFLPIVGDWNGDGIDTVGIYDPASGAFFLRNSNTNGPADVLFSFGPGNEGFRPIAGDWNGDNICTIGLYKPAAGLFLLRNSNSNGPADVTFTFGPGAAGIVPLAGSWDGQ